MFCLFADCQNSCLKEMTIAVKELRGAKLATILDRRMFNALDMDKSNVYFYCDSLIVIDQIQACRKKRNKWIHKRSRFQGVHSIT